jgi:uncharacterized membrane protein
MTGNHEDPGKQAAALHRLSNTFDAVRRAFSEFLRIPTGIIVVFLLLAVCSYLLDQTRLAWLEPARQLLKRHVFADPKATSELLGAIAAGIITMTSVTISLLLVAVQQAASSLTGAVYDQFLRRRQNQIYFGFFVGLALYALITLATVNAPFNPVFGGAVAFFGTVVALYLLILLLYTTINQMRPVEIIEAIHDHVLSARQRQEKFLTRTRRTSRVTGPSRACVRAGRNGFVTAIDLNSLDQVLSASSSQTEVILLVSSGSNVAFQTPVAEIKTDAAEEIEKISDAIHCAVRLERQRDILVDPAYGIEQLEMIGWTSILDCEIQSRARPSHHLQSARHLRALVRQGRRGGRGGRERGRLSGRLQRQHAGRVAQCLRNPRGCLLGIDAAPELYRCPRHLYRHF